MYMNIRMCKRNSNEVLFCIFHISSGSDSSSSSSLACKKVRLTVTFGGKSIGRCRYGKAWRKTSFIIILFG